MADEGVVANDAKKSKSRKRKRVRARPVFPGQTIKITIRCRDGQLLMTNPDDLELARQTFGFVLGVALQKYGAAFHGGTQQANHHHQDITDLLGNRPEFKAFFHSFLARAFNEIHGRSNGVFQRGGSWDTEWDSDEELFDLVYTDTNPVKHAQVKRGAQWPLFTTAGWRFGESREFKRPNLRLFNSEDGDWPETVTVTRVRPPCLEHLSDDEATELLKRRVAEREAELRAQHRRNGRRIRGLSKVRKDKWWKIPKKPPSNPGNSSRVASTCRWKKAALEQRNRKWEAAYAEAREALLAGKRDVEFPYGTWWMRVRCGVAVAGPPS